MPILIALAIVLVPHVALGFVLGRLGAVRGFIIEAALLFGAGILASLGLMPGFGRGSTPEAWVGLYGIIGAILPVVGLGYALGVTLRWPLRLPRTGLLWRVTRAA
jgi:hypothetical protein